jgi:hypothetical protein
MEQRENDEFDEYDDDISNTRFAAQILELQVAYALAAIQSQIHEKVSTGQTNNIVLNLADSICDAANINSHFLTNQLRGLKNIIVLKPKRDSEAVDRYSTKDGTYALYPPEAFSVNEYNY